MVTELNTPLFLPWQIERRIPARSGDEKTVFPVRRDGILSAAKIFRDRNKATGRRLDKSAESVKELAAYLLLQGSPLGFFVPVPLDLIRKHGQIVGLLVDWRDGETLENQYGRLFLPPEIFSDFESSLLQMPEGAWLHPDSLGVWNLGWDGRSLWLAEPKLGQYSGAAAYRETVSGQIRLLKKYYCK